MAPLRSFQEKEKEKRKISFWGNRACIYPEFQLRICPAPRLCPLSFAVFLFEYGTLLGAKKAPKFSYLFVVLSFGISLLLFLGQLDPGGGGAESLRAYIQRRAEAASF